MLFYVYIEELMMRARTSDALRRELEDDIEHGRLSPGDRLDEQTLAERFEVSRTPAQGIAGSGAHSRFLMYT